jgi:phage FluMu protein Com
LRKQIQRCPYCGRQITLEEGQGKVQFECPLCRSTLSFVHGPMEKHVRQLVMLAVTIFYAWHHGWDGGFVIFYLGLYGCVGLFVYFVFVLPVLPVRLKLVARPISAEYLNVAPLSNRGYDELRKKRRPLDIT